MIKSAVLLQKEGRGNNIIKEIICGKPASAGMCCHKPLREIAGAQKHMNDSSTVGGKHIIIV